jgi:multiple sugar transport system substrate-binding protein
MSQIVLRGLVWDHPRATAPLNGCDTLFHARYPTVRIEWDVQALSGFEFASVPELARRYDLLIFDHPHVGEVAATHALLPLDYLRADEDDGVFVGPSAASYRWDNQTWGLPIDGACQVAVARPDLLAHLGAPPPGNWDEVLALGDLAAGQGLRLGIAAAGVHALMTLFSLCASLGHPFAIETGPAAVAPAAARRALEAMRNLLHYCPTDCLDWNSIALQDTMSTRDDVVYCPAVYGFVPYAESRRERRLSYHAFPGIESPGGSTIGGAGIGVSAHCRAPEEALAYAEFLASEPIQVEVFPRHLGQPARRSAWSSAHVNARFGNFYTNTLDTIDRAWVRPRFDGYLAIQKMGGDLLESHLRGRIREDTLLADLDTLWRRPSNGRT